MHTTEIKENSQEFINIKTEETLKECESEIDKINEKLKTNFDDSSKWIESILLTVGFYLLSITAEAPEEFEILGVKLNITEDYRGIFLWLIGIAMILQLIQGWFFSHLNNRIIEQSFLQIQKSLNKISKVLTYHLIENKNLCDKFVNSFSKRISLPNPELIFDYPDIDFIQEENGNVVNIDFNLENFREELIKKFAIERTEIKRKNLDAWYPENLWNSAVISSIDYIIAKRQAQYMPPKLVQIYEDVTEKNFDISDITKKKELEKLKLTNKKAILALKNEINIFDSKSSEELNNSNDELESLSFRTQKMLKDLKFFQKASKFRNFLYLIVPTVSAIISVIAVISKFLIQ